MGGLGAIGAGLCSIGIPKDSVVKYETAIKSDKFLVLAHGTADEVAKVEGHYAHDSPGGSRTAHRRTRATRRGQCEIVLH